MLYMKKYYIFKYMIIIVTDTYIPGHLLISPPEELGWGDCNCNMWTCRPSSIVYYDM